MSERLHRLIAVVRADVLIRMRRPSTAVVFILLSVIPYMWIPDPSTGRTLMQIGGGRALYNSAAIGMATAVLGSMFIGLFGFYVISNALRRDVLSRCGFVIASTTMRGSEYIVGKFAGNVAFLTLFTLGYMGVAMIMVLVRGEAPLEPLLFAWQYVLLLPPAIAFVSATAVAFECTPLLRTKLGDVLYFFLWLGMMGAVASSAKDAPWMHYFDISGFGFLQQQMQDGLGTDSLSIGSSTFDKTKPLVVFEGLGLRGGWLLPRLGSTLWPMLLLVFARIFFHRFDPARVRAMPNEKSRRSWLGRLNMLARPLATLIVRMGELVARVPAPALVRAMIVDATASMASFPLAAVAIIGFGIAALTSEAEALFTGVLPAAFAAAAIAIADIGCREKRAGTSALLFAAPGLRTRFVFWKFGSTLLVAVALLAIPVGRAIALRPASAAALTVGVLFVAALATTLAIVSANPKTFIVVFLMFWYVSLSDKGGSPYLDFAGWFGTTIPAVTATFAAIALGSLLLAQMFHLSELRRRW